MLDKNLIVIDLETSGSDPQTCSVIQIGATRLSKDFKIGNTFKCYVIPYTNTWEEEAAGIHNLSKTFLGINGLDILRALDYFEEWIQEIWKLDDIYLAMWSNGWDMEVLKNAYKYLHKLYPFNYKSYDIASFVRLWLASKVGIGKKCGLFKCANKLGIDTIYFEQHNALDDSLLATHLLVRVNTIIQYSKDFKY